MSHENTDTTQKVVVVGTVSLEGLSEANSQRLRYLLTPSLESQQLDEHNAKLAAEAQSEAYLELIRGERPTGVTHLFVLDPEGLAEGSVNDQQTLMALAAASMQSKDEIIAALLPPPGLGLTTAGQAAAEDVKDQYLTGIVTVESHEALDALLNAV